MITVLCRLISFFFMYDGGDVLLFRFRYSVRIDFCEISLHRDRDEAFGDVIRRFRFPVLSAPFANVIVRDDHIRLRFVGVSFVYRVIHHTGIAAAVAEGKHRAFADLALHVDRLVTVQVFLYEAAGENEFIAVFVFEIHIGRLILVPLLLDLKSVPITCSGST